MDHIRERLATLEERIKNADEELDILREEQAEIKKRLSFYDRLAIRWGGVLMGIIACGALIGGQFETVIKKIIELSK